MFQDLESSPPKKRDSLIVQLWKTILGSELVLVKPTQKYLWPIGILFGIGIFYVLLISKFHPHYLTNQTQKISTLFQNPTLGPSKSTFPNNNIAIWMTNVSTQLQLNSGTIDGNATATTPSSPPKDVDILQYQNTSVTWHFLSDENLRQNASRVPRNPSGQKIAYMFIVKDTMPFAPLWERYFHGHEDQYSIYIHAHPNYKPSFNSTSPFFRRFVPSKVAQWGRVSLQEAENRLIFNALLDARNSWFLLLSESCIPVDNFPDTYKHITGSNHSFVMSFQESKVLQRTRLQRGRHWEMAPEVGVDTFRKGSQWFQINRDLALVVANDAIYYEKFVNSFCQPRPVCYIDEHYLPTLFFIERPEAIAWRTLTFFQFHPNSAHPIKWDKTNTTGELVMRIRGAYTCWYNGQLINRCHSFARKFDPSALPNLLELARDVMGIQ